MDNQQREDTQRSPRTPPGPEDHTRSWWRSPFLGYPLAIVLVAGAFLIPWGGRLLSIPDYFIEPPFVMVTLLVGWFWGIGPALLALFLQVLALDYWIIPSVGVIDFFLWPDIASFAPFILLQLILLWLITVQKRYRRYLLIAHRAAAATAEELAERNRQLAQNNAQLDVANRLKDQFLSLASHELKTPITTIQGQAQLALHRLARLPPLPENVAFLSTHLEKVEAQTHRLSDLVNDLLNLSSLRSGKFPLRLAPCDLCALCQEIVEDQRTLSNRSICLNMPPAPVMLQADEGRISQVIINLVVNAIKYSPASSLIKVNILRGEAQAMLIVQNEGPVIPPERLAHLFEPFYRTPEVQVSRIQGWGLGLAISKEMIEQHGGSIRVESSEEQGTTFCVVFPLQPGEKSGT